MLFLGLTEDEEKELERLYRAGRSYVALSAETLNLFGYMSEGCYKLMCDETLVTRIAEMANYFLDLLVGKKRKTLKVTLVNNEFQCVRPKDFRLKWTSQSERSYRIIQFWVKDRSLSGTVNYSLTRLRKI